jgi:predicted acyl esterase
MIFNMYRIFTTRIWSAEKWPMALGWLRLSHRELDHDKSTPWEPYLKSVVGPGQKVRPGDIVPCDIPLLPTSTLFRKGETLKLDISGIYRGGERK